MVGISRVQPAIVYMAWYSSSSGLQRDVIQHLMEAVDVWHVGSDGSVVFRVRSEEFQEMKRDLLECREEGNVEELVREMEKRYFNKTQQDEWFERYVCQYNPISFCSPSVPPLAASVL
jgi:hypothetical protein